MRTEKGENILIEATGVDYQLVNALIKETYKVGAYPFVELYDNKVQRQLLMGMDRECAQRMSDFGCYRMDKTDAYIGIRGGELKDGKGIVFTREILAPYIQKY